MGEVSGVRMVVIGGGTGSFTLLSALKRYVGHLTAIVNMVDDGGSTGVLRDELGALPPGDVRQCLVALSHSPRVRELFNYRFEEGTFAGHAFGNLFLSALERITGSFAEAVETAAEVLAVRGTVVPVTLDDVHLMLREPGGTLVRGESRVGASRFAGGRRPELFLSPQPRVNPAAIVAIHAADMVVIAPGDLYASLAPTLLVPGIGDALAISPARVVYVCNLMTKPGQTDGFQVHDFAAEIERFAGRPVLEHVLYNTERPGAELRERYAREHEYGVGFDPAILQRQHYGAVGDTFLAGPPQMRTQVDLIAHRTLIRHNADRVARHLMRLYFS